MALGPLIFLAVLALVHHPRMVSDDRDQATLARLQEHEHRLTHERGRLERELNQKEWSWDPRRSQEDLVPSDLPAGDGTWDGWHYVVLSILIIFGCSRYSMKKEPSYDSSSDSAGSTTTTEDCDDMDGEPESSRPNQPVLEAFYDRHVKMEPGDLESMCDFVTSFVNDLLEACRRALPYQNTLPLLENCIGIGSAFEGWHTQVSQTYTVLVPALPPKGLSFWVETGDFEGSLSGHGHISVEMDCMCKRERLLGDVVCFLHHPEREPSDAKQGAFLMHALCTSSHLDVEKTIRWFQELVAQAWHETHPKYNFDLAPQPSSTVCRLKLGFRSGRSITVDIILGVQQSNSLVFLVTQGGETDRAAGTTWRKTFAVQELLFFKWVSQRLPKDPCHLKCLQILIYFRESLSSDKNPVLTNYHYKTCLMHLLLHRSPWAWESRNFLQGLQYMLWYLDTALQKKHLQHFLIGNISFPIRIPLPQALRTAAPPNLFEHLAADPALHAEALKEFLEVTEGLKALWSEHEE
ncbi:hypothetical protein JRQ81_011162 [Phrynocephalus forsythii]|uniref:Mab-21-like HhH/H2TH-like domain-containing protein n=1 Tax=Phrynocephalus forsythii TaxID=171643 RepID=A0A9Q0X9J9_9SAUR|nr:hypothetical protein JRQ81_011162 [Phrynocephalus forsythii]